MVLTTFRELNILSSADHVFHPCGWYYARTTRGSAVVIFQNGLTVTDDRRMSLDFVHSIQKPTGSQC